jgi:PAS domain S-box-containing protein
MLPSSPTVEPAPERTSEETVRGEQVRLQYGNTNLSVGVTFAVSLVLGFLQWAVIPHGTILTWLAYMYLVSLGRFGLRQFYRTHSRTMRPWGLLFSIGAGLSAAGWGAAGVVLYPSGHLTNQVFLTFVLGGMMVGAASVLAARVVDFALFIALGGLPTALHLLSEGDDVHLAMGLLGALYTMATLITAWRVHQTIIRSLKLRFENQGLLTGLTLSTRQGEVLNDKLLAEAGERQRASAAMEKSEKRLELALFGADLGLWDWNIETGEVFWDRQWAAMLGYELEELQPALSTWEHLIHPDDRLHRKLAIEKHLQGAEPSYESDQRMSTKSGEWKWIRSRGKIVARDAGGRPLRITGTNRDVTEQRRIQDALRQSHEVLESRVQERTAKLGEAVALLREEIAERQRAEQERERMAAHLQNAQKLEAVGILAKGIAHDFNNILTSIIGFTALAKDELPPDARAQDHLEQVAKAGERAAALVRRLLVFSRKSDAANRPVEIVPVIVDTLQLLRASIPSSIELRQDIDPDCGYVQADPALIQQVTMNLCTNAYQAMQSSVGRLTVTLAPIVLDNSHATLRPGSYVKLTVSDTGPGISPKEAGPGSGLGLAVVQGVVTDCGGSVSFESTPGKGTSYFVYLPQVAAIPDEAAKVPGPAPGGSERILFVDDEEDIAKLAARLLHDLGYGVVSKTSSLAALQLFTADPHAFDLVISDFTMPNMTGGEFIGKLRDLRPDIPAILISGYQDAAASLDQNPRMPFVERVKKPFSRSDLALAIRRALERKATDSVAKPRPSAAS